MRQPKLQNVRALAICGLLTLSCGGSGGAGPAPGGSSPVVKSGPVISSEPLPAGAPSWAAGGDSSSDTGYRFVCQGEGASEAEALQTAQALCEDKICKLCGVSVESVVKTKETLTGVEATREVIERCKRVRRTDTKVERKIVDCGPEGCGAWVAILYDKKDQLRECQQLTADNYADPEACQTTIEAFRKVPGYDAASFRTRVKLLDDAIAQCADIDVRPTPLMNSLDEKLKVGMNTWLTREARAPGYLREHWLSSYAPLWQSFKESDKFIPRLVMLRGYLANKVLIMDVIEASLVEPPDTAPALATLMKAMRAISPEEAYGRGRVHFFALDQWVQAHRKNKSLAVSTAELNSFFREQYPPDELQGWSELLNMTKLFAFDGRIDDDEWAYTMKVRNWKRGVQMLLETADHGNGARGRFDRFHAALKRSLSEEKEPFRGFELVRPMDAMFILDLEPQLPDDVREGYDWKSLEDVYQRTNRELTPQERTRLLDRMEKALANIPSDAKEARSFCIGMSKGLELLDAHRPRSAVTAPAVCTCLDGPLTSEGLSLVNKSELYRDALDRNLPCVAPKGEKPTAPRAPSAKKKPCEGYASYRSSFAITQGRAHASKLDPDVRFSAKVDAPWYRCAKAGSTLEVRFFSGPDSRAPLGAIRPDVIVRGLESSFRESGDQAVLDAPVPVAALCKAGVEHWAWEVSGKGELSRIGGGGRSTIRCPVKR